VNKVIAWVGLVVGLAGCGTERAYEGPELPSSEQALIIGDPQVASGFPIRAVIRKVDARVPKFGNSSVAVLPGQHAVLVDCVMANHAVVRFPLTIEAEAGRRYVLRAQSTPGNRTCADVQVDVQ
jgi:hypothetical protein